MSDHPFKIGGIYRNDIGDYEVLAIAGDRMTIHYEDGTNQKVGISLQTRIWQRIQDEAAGPPAGRTTASRRRSGNRGSGESWRGLKTAPIRELVADVLAAEFSAPYPKDITNLVAQRIEANPEWFARYQAMFDEMPRDTIHNWIGAHTKDLTGMVAVKHGVKAEDSFLTSYTQLDYHVSDR